MSETQDQEGKASLDPGFAPEDFTDGRKIGEWRSRYEPEAQSSIRWEAAYLAIALALIVTTMFLIWIGVPQTRLGLSDQQSRSFERYAIATLSGVSGGILFAMKWLYHSVAKQIWNLDRRWWRYFAPIISGGLAFATILVVQSFGVFDPSLVSTNSRTAAFGFLVGLFSDNAMAKLAEVAQTLFGPSHRRASQGSK